MMLTAVWEKKLELDLQGHQIYKHTRKTTNVFNTCEWFSSACLRVGIPLIGHPQTGHTMCGLVMA